MLLPLRGRARPDTFTYYRVQDGKSVSRQYTWIEPYPRVPDDPRRPYDMHDVISRVVDDGAFLEIQPGWAANIIVGFARLGGRSIGIVAQQPSVLAGALDIER